MVVRRFGVADQKTSTGGQGVNGEPAPPAPLTRESATETCTRTTASLPKGGKRRRGTGLRARALFIGLVGVMAIAAMLTLATSPLAQSRANGSDMPAARTPPSAMAPQNWPAIYAKIASRNAAARARKSQAILQRKRVHSPVDWSSEDCGSPERDGWSDRWEEGWLDDGVPMEEEAANEESGPGELELCPSCGADTNGWGSWDCGHQAGCSATGATPSTWSRSPSSKRLRRLSPANPAQCDAPAQPDDPWAGLVQPHWGGDWGALTPPLWRMGTGEKTTAAVTTVAAAAAAAVAVATAEASPTTPPQVGDDPWEPHPWASWVQPTWGGPWT